MKIQSIVFLFIMLILIIFIAVDSTSYYFFAAADTFDSFDNFSNKKVGIVASSDLTHFGAGYGFLPTSEDPLQWMGKVDNEILSGIKYMSPETVYTASSKTTACGYGSISAMITACEKLGLTEAEILEYRTSYDVSQDTHHIVGYGAAVIK